MTMEKHIDAADYRGLVELARRRIPAASRGRWTLHAPVDPGMTLVELFAWLLDQRSFVADQVTAPIVRGLLRFLGDTIHGARPAAVPLGFAPEFSAGLGQVTVPRRARLRPAGTALRFGTTHALAAVPVTRYAETGTGRAGQPSRPGAPVVVIRRDGRLVADDLRAGRPVEVLAADGRRAAVELGVMFATAPQPSDATTGWCLELDAAGPVAPAWSPERADAPPPAALTWRYRRGPGAWPGLVVDDGTGGLRRSGVVRFRIPADWAGETMTVGGVAGQVYWLRVETMAATFSAPPRITALRPNVVVARHQVWRTPALAPDVSAWLPLPGCAIELEPEGGLAMPQRCAVWIRERDGRTRRWREVPDFTRAGPGDRVFVVDRASGRLRFGDGLTGRIPRPVDGDAVRVSFAAGGGEVGNVGPVAWDALDGPLPRAESAVAATGGRDEERPTEAQDRVAGAMRIPTRGVTPDDIERLALATPGVAVARAFAAVGRDPDECGVVPGVTTVYVVPAIAGRDEAAVADGRAPTAPAADPGLLAAVRAQLERGRLAGERLLVRAATYRRVGFTVVVAGAGADPGEVRRRTVAALRIGLDALRGGGRRTDDRGWPFGAPLRPSELSKLIQERVGDHATVEAVVIHARGDVRGEACDQVALQPFELVEVGAVEVVVTTAIENDGGLR